MLVDKSLIVLILAAGKEDVGGLLNHERIVVFKGERAERVGRSRTNMSQLQQVLKTPNGALIINLRENFNVAEV